MSDDFNGGRIIERERDSARAEAAALRAALRRLADYEGGAADIDHARTTLASDAGRKALDAVRAAQRALKRAWTGRLPTTVSEVTDERDALDALRDAFGEP